MVPQPGRHRYPRLYHGPTHRPGCWKAGSGACYRPDRLSDRAGIRLSGGVSKAMSELPVDLTDFSGARVLVVGDVMLDRFVYGGVQRISPEAPIPVMQAERAIVMPGGAGNV